MDATLFAYLAIGAMVLVAAVGAPLPVSSALTAAGALAAAAKLDLVILIFVAWLGAVAGDTLGYTTGQIGRRWFRHDWRARTPWLAWLQRHILGRKSVRQIVAWCDGMLGKRGGMGTALLLTRTVLAAFGPVVNVISGARRYPLGRFLLYDVVGELLWAGTYVSIGFFAGSQSADISAVFTNPVVIAATILFTVAPMIVVFRVRRGIVTHAPGELPSGD